MTNLFAKIVKENIMNYYTGEAKDGKPIPTVIIAPKISIDNSTIMTDIVSFMYQFSGNNMQYKPPLLIITNVNAVDYEILSDIWRLCGCKPIKKYINPDIQKKDIEEGKAPTLDTVVNFYGFADEIKSDAFKTSFINPKDMFVEEDGTKTYSQIYESQLNFISQQLKLAQEQDETIDVIYNLKRRLHSLQANMIDYLVGGVTVTDRDSVRALVEDSVKNIRSAA
jgi:hypothetical protein